MDKNRSNEILELLSEVIDNPKCELEYTSIFSLLVAVVLSSQTTDKRVNMVTKILFNKYETIIDLANANYDDLYQILLPLGLAKNKTSNLILLAKTIHEKYNDIVPSDIKELESLPGVGHKTASVLLAEGYKIPALPVDTHVHRMAIRLGYIEDGMSIKDTETALKSFIDKDKWILSHHLFLLFGRYYCKSKMPKCDMCRLKKYCKYK